MARTYQDIFRRRISIPSIAKNLPAVHDDKESANDGTSNGIRIQLTDPSDQHSPCNSAQETIHVGIDGSTYISRVKTC